MLKIYLAAPYSSPDPAIRHQRAALASQAAAHLMLKGHCVFSPITHGHFVADWLPAETALDHEFWMGQCLPMLADCDLLVVLTLPDWHLSRGIQRERRFAEDLNLPELFMPGQPSLHHTFEVSNV